MLTKEDLIILSLKHNEVSRSLSIIYKHLDQLKSDECHDRIIARQVINAFFINNDIKLIIVPLTRYKKTGNDMKVTIVDSLLKQKMNHGSIYFGIFDLPAVENIENLYE